MKTNSNITFAFIAALAMSSQAQAVIISETWNPATEAPPTVLGDYGMVPFEDEHTPSIFNNIVQKAVSPSSGTIEFSPMVRHYKVTGTASPWETWGNRSTDDAYYFMGSGNLLTKNGDSLALTLPPDTKAFYLFVESEESRRFTFAVDSSLGTTTFPLEGKGGAQGIAFYTDADWDHIQSISIANPGNVNNIFFVGSFGINGFNIESEADTFSLDRMLMSEESNIILNGFSVPDGAIHPLLFSSILLSLGTISHLVQTQTR